MREPDVPLELSLESDFDVPLELELSPESDFDVPPEPVFELELPDDPLFEPESEEASESPHRPRPRTPLCPGS